MSRNFLLAALVAAAFGIGTASADTLIVEGIEQAESTSSDRPVRGMSMDRVSARWGAPLSRGAAVGQPPITRWEYPGFVVFFEYDHVIHAVGRRS